MLSNRYLAALRWLQAEVGQDAPRVALIAAAEKELKRPRDATHRGWAKEFLQEQRAWEKV